MKISKKGSVVAIIIFIAVLAAGWFLVSQNQKQNKSLSKKIDAISAKLAGWEVAGISTSVAENSTTSNQTNGLVTSSRAILGVSDEVVISNVATPMPSPSAPKILKVRTSPTPTRTSTPTPTPTPTSAPTPVIKQVTVEIQNQGIYKVELQENDNAYTVLARAAAENGFALETIDYGGSLGIMVTGIGGVNAHDNYFWAFYYNGAMSMVGASSQPVSDGDTTSWKFETW